MAVEVLAAYLTLHFPGEVILIQYMDDILLVSADASRPHTETTMLCDREAYSATCARACDVPPLFFVQMRRLSSAVSWFLLSLLLCAGTHIPAFMLLRPPINVLPKQWVFPLFICQSAVCLVVLALLAHKVLGLHWFRAGKGSVQEMTYSPSSVTLMAQLSGPACPGPPGPGGGAESTVQLSELQERPRWLLLVTAVVLMVDLLWALCGVSSLWFLVAIFPSPHALRCGATGAAVGVAVLCGVVQCCAGGGQAGTAPLGPTHPPSWHAAALHAAAALQPTFLMLLQVLASHSKGGSVEALHAPAPECPLPAFPAHSSADHSECEGKHPPGGRHPFGLQAPADIPGVSFADNLGVSSADIPGVSSAGVPGFSSGATCSSKMITREQSSLSGKAGPSSSRLSCGFPSWITQSHFAGLDELTAGAPAEGGTEPGHGTDAEDDADLGHRSVSDSACLPVPPLRRKLRPMPRAAAPGPISPGVDGCLPAVGRCASGAPAHQTAPEAQGPLAPPAEGPPSQRSATADHLSPYLSAKAVGERTATQSTLSAQGTSTSDTQLLGPLEIQRRATFWSQEPTYYEAPQSPSIDFTYSVSKMIATGGFSDVYLGLCHNTGELVCLKQPAAGYSEKDITVMEVAVLHCSPHAFAASFVWMLWACPMVFALVMNGGPALNTRVFKMLQITQGIEKCPQNPKEELAPPPFPPRFATFVVNRAR